MFNYLHVDSPLLAIHTDLISDDPGASFPIISN